MFVTAVVARAVRYRKQALIVAISGSAGCGLPILLAFVEPRIFGHVVRALFPLFIGITMFGWGIVLVASWFGPAKRHLPRKRGALSGFAARSFNAYLAVFVAAWLVVAVGLLGWSVITLILAVAGALALFGA